MDQKQNNEHLLHEYNEDMITHAAKLVALEEQEAAEQFVAEAEALPEPPYSEAFRAEMAALLAEENKAAKKEKRRGRARSLRRRLLSAAACFACLFVIGNATFAVSSEAYQEYLKYLVQKVFHTHTVYSTEIAIPERYKQKLLENGWESILYPSYLPYEFVLTDIESSKLRCILVFSHGEEFVNISIKKAVDNIKFIANTEGTETEDLTVNGRDAKYISEDSINHLILLIGEDMISISSASLHKLQMISIAESLQTMPIE